MDEIISFEIFSDKQAILHFVPAAFLPKIRKNTAVAPPTLRFSFEDFPRPKIGYDSYHMNSNTIVKLKSQITFLHRVPSG